MGKSEHLHGRVACCAVFVLLCQCVPATASPESSQLIDDGLAELQKGQAESALKFFADATREDPKDAEAAFFAGVALNRLGRAQEAFSQLSAAKQLGSTHPDLPFEMGWSLLTLRRWDEAIEQLNRYEAENPGRGQTSEFLGRAYLATGKYKEAEAAFTEALKRDPDLLPTVSVYRALLRQRQGDEAAARDELSGLFRAAPTSPLTQLIGSQLPRTAAYAGTGDWSLALGTAIGYNTNARGARLLRPTDPNLPRPVRNSGFARVTLDAGYAPINRSDERLTLGYNLLSDSYFRQTADPDVLDQNLYLEYWRALGDHFTTTLRIWDNNTFVGEEKFRNEAAAQGSLASRITQTLFLEGSYRYAYDDYSIDNPNDLDPGPASSTGEDGQQHTLTVAAELVVPQIRSRLRGGYFHTWNFARGDDFDYHSNGVFGGIHCSLPWQFTAEAFYVHTWDRYQDPNSSFPITIPPTTSEKRRDDTDSVTIRLTRQLTRHVNLYIEYNFNHDNSNLTGYDYEQHITSGGLIWHF